MGYHRLRHRSPLHQPPAEPLAHLLGWHHLQDIASFATLSRVDVAKLIDALQAETAT